MKKQGMKAVLMTLALLLSAACADNNESAGAETQPGEAMDESSGDTDQAKDDGEATGDTEVPKDEAMVPIAMMWEESVETTTGNVDGLRLEVKNRTAFDFDIAVTLHFAGMIKMTADVERETEKLSAFETKTIFVPASEVPLQTSTGAASVTAEVAVMSGEETPEMLFSSSEVFFRHSADFNSLISFDMNYLVDNLDGVMTPDTPAVSADAQGPAGISAPTLGRIKNAEGFRSLAISAAEFVDIVDGEIMGRELGSSVSMDTWE